MLRVLKQTSCRAPDPCYTYPLQHLILLLELRQVISIILALLYAIEQYS